MTKAQVKNNVHNDITTKTAVNSISPTNVGQNMEDIIDLIPDPTTPIPGPQGLSAYQVWLAAGNVGTIQNYLDSLVGPQGDQGIQGLSGVDGVDGSGAISYLPTPQIAKRKIFIPDGKISPSNDRQRLESITPRLVLESDLINYYFPEEYYLEQFDISFNSFSLNTNNWLSLPDKRLELCLVSNKTNKFRPRTHPEISGEGNKDKSTNSIVHPINYNDNIGIINTTTGFDNKLSQTEWLLDETSNSFGDNIFNNGLNGLNNPNITIKLDIREFFCNRDSVDDKLKYPKILDGSDGRIKVRKIGIIGVNSSRNKVYRRNSVIYFRLSAGVPGTQEETLRGTRYNKRIYSGLSLPIYISPKIRLFTDDFGDWSLAKPYMYGHTTTIGSK